MKIDERRNGWTHRSMKIQGIYRTRLGVEIVATTASDPGSATALVCSKCPGSICDDKKKHRKGIVIATTQALTKSIFRKTCAVVCRVPFPSFSIAVASVSMATVSLIWCRTAPVWTDGCTGAGKSYTMIGEGDGADEQRGMCTRALQHVFREASRRTARKDITVAVRTPKLYLLPPKRFLSHRGGGGG